MKQQQESLVRTGTWFPPSPSDTSAFSIRPLRDGDCVLLVGNSGPTHIGSHLIRAAKELAVSLPICDSREAFEGPSWWRRANWWLRGHRPARLRAFSRGVVDTCLSLRPKALICTGTAPLVRRALERIGREGIVRINYLTDDPWNPAHRAVWFLESLPAYDLVFSPRRANLGDLRSLGCDNVTYLPFAYAPDEHFFEPPANEEEEHRFDADVVFAGGADGDRVACASALIRGGWRVALYGGYWERFPETRASALGLAEPPVLRRAIAGSKVSLCLVRRANRDGHAMRSFEVPAMRGCMLAEDTGEHREIFGGDGECVVYFRGVKQMLERLSWLLANAEERERLTKAAHRRITGGRNTYRDRLETMLLAALE